MTEFERKVEEIKKKMRKGTARLVKKEWGFLHHVVSDKTNRFAGINLTNKKHKGGGVD